MASRAMVIVGGGSSTRFGGDKLLADVAGNPLLVHTVDAIKDSVDLCVVVCRSDMVERIEALGLDVAVTSGGATRTQSEMAGLKALGEAGELIGIHDAARPFVSPELVRLLFATAEEVGGAVPVVPCDLPIIDRRTRRPIPRLMRAQTPQVFRGADLTAAYAMAARDGFEADDTVEVMHRFSDVSIAAVRGDEHNVKITYPEDLSGTRHRLRDSSHT